MSREVPGSTREEQAVAVAGALAEQGVQKLILVREGWSERLIVRETDLPAVFRDAPPGSQLTCPDLGITIEIATGLTWSAADQDAARRFSGALGQTTPD